MAEDVAPKPGLYVTATPIGNLGDISRRALALLAAVDVIACEDTRTTGKLLSRYGIRTRCIAYHDHNAARVRPRILERIKEGQSVALVSDAGTPMISDPGFKLVAEALDAGLMVTTLPGASAVLAALAVAGLPTDRFLFAGFPPPKKTARRKMLAGLAETPATLVFYESPKRLVASLEDMTAALGASRQAAVCRELTKLHEEVRRGSLEDLCAEFAARERIRGEIAIVVAPPPAAGPDSDASIDRALREALEKLSLKEAAHAVAYITGASRKKVYSRALEIREGK
ncbi:MAG: 16S rRNA (cytidine(1402)-2'-O)-methyltransferase [Proteobacteria bacterium]|nr:16S rRNA (cytidine(1402)-2'-O)-methyltransferase [Pseudomonadota bacterium]